MTLTVSFLKMTLDEELHALHDAQDALRAAQRRSADACAAKAKQEADREAKSARRAALEA